MSDFMVKYDGREFHSKVEKLLEKGVLPLFKLTKRMMSGASTKDIGEIVIAYLVIDKALDAYLRVGGERAEEVYTDYYYAKACAYGMAGKAHEGREYLEKARVKRSGGIYDEWCQDYY